MDQYEKSGLSKVEFCKQHGINLAVFWYWFRKYKQGDLETPKEFVEVQGLPMKRVKMELEIGEQKLFFYEFPPAAYMQDILGIK